MSDADSPRPAIARVLPAADWLAHYDRSFLRPDVMAGVVAGSVVIPQAMAYGTIAGLPVQVGLYTCIVPMITYALLGGARRMSISTTSTIVALTGLGLTAAGVSRNPDDLVAAMTTLTLLVGLTLWVARVLRLGFLVECVSETVMIGLKVGVGITIAVDQLPALLGISSTDGGFFSDLHNIVTSRSEIQGQTLLLSVAALVVLFVAKSSSRHIPGPLIVIVGSIVAVLTLNLEDQGVKLIPDVPRGLPIPSLPPLEHIRELLPYAFAIALMAYLESVTVARTTRDSDDPPLDNGHEFVAVGASSVIGSFFQSLPAAGGFSQTLVNAEAGAKTQLSELVTAVLAVFVALVLAPLISDVPSAALAAVVMVAVLGLIDIGELRRLARIDRVELAVAIITGVVALCTNLLVGVLVGVVMTFYLVLRGLNHPTVIELRRGPGEVEFLAARDGDLPIDGMLVLRVEGGLYTVNVSSVVEELHRAAIAADPPPGVLLVDVSGTADTTVTVIDAFSTLDQQLKREGIELWIAGLPARALVKAQRLKAWPDLLEAGKVHRSVSAAVDTYLDGKPLRRRDRHRSTSRRNGGNTAASTEESTDG